MNMVHTDGLVQRIELSGGHVPSVIVYSDRQISDVKSICFGIEKQSDRYVLGFDKTYNLGAIFVTPSVYKHPALTRRRTGNNPVFLGPIFIHGHSDFSTYNYFFAHLLACFSDCPGDYLTVGSDDEVAMCKAMQHSFGSASFIVCTRHLKENVVRQLDAHMSNTSTLQKRLVAELFGTNGLTSFNDVISFDDAAQKFRRGTLQEA